MTKECGSLFVSLLLGGGGHNYSVLYSIPLCDHVMPLHV